MEIKLNVVNYIGISLIPPTYKILSSILVSRLTPHVDEMIGNHQCGIQCNRSTTDQTFICQIMKKKWEYNRMAHQLFMNYEKAHDSVMREVLYNILTEFGIPMKLVTLITMCLNKTQSKVHISKNLCDAFPIQNGLKQGNALSPQLLKFSLEYSIGAVQENQKGLELSGTHQLCYRLVGRLV
jgi:hypothetical protein